MHTHKTQVKSEKWEWLTETLKILSNLHQMNRKYQVPVLCAHQQALYFILLNVFLYLPILDCFIERLLTTYLIFRSDLYIILYIYRDFVIVWSLKLQKNHIFHFFLHVNFLFCQSTRKSLRKKCECQYLPNSKRYMLVGYFTWVKYDSRADFIMWQMSVFQNCPTNTLFHTIFIYNVATVTEP